MWVSFRFGEHLNEALKELAPGCQIKFLVSEDGSGKGTAIVTAVAQRLATQRKHINEIFAPFLMSLAKLKEIQSRMRNEMEIGLHKQTQPRATVKMLPTYVRATPDGTGKGQILINIMYNEHCYYMRQIRPCIPKVRS